MHSGNLSQIAFPNIWLLVLTEITRTTHITNIFITRTYITDIANNTVLLKLPELLKIQTSLKLPTLLALLVLLILPASLE